MVHDIEGTHDWVSVTEVFESEHYDWREIRAFYSPSVRQFFWHGDCGCSCNSWDPRVVGDFEHGNRAALKKALREFITDKADYMMALAELDSFKEEGK